MKKGFEKDFVWGSATASYQVEGAAFEDGKGLSIWDVFTGLNRCFENNTGSVACDQYHKYRDDVRLIKQLGHKAYRFSIGWPRIFPEGTGKINEKGLDYYRRLTDALLENGIQPYVTLYHWDLPYSLYLKGGWLNPESPKWFTEYTAAVVKALPKVKHFITFNEPQCVVAFGMGTGAHAPGIRLPEAEQMIAVHNILLAHGEAVKVIRDLSDAEVGFAPTCPAHYPVSDSEEDVEAARRAFFSLDTDACPMFNLSSYCDPVYFGAYPQGALERYGKYLKIGSGDFETISRPVDFHCQNVYNGRPVKSDGKSGWAFADRKTGWEKTASGWPITPQSLYYAPTFIYERYKKPFYISENGMSAHDVVSLDGKVHDYNRIDFLHRYLSEYKRAAQDGVDARGYFLWSLLDNFEWAEGYNQRFGIVYVDYETGKRIVKDSALWYREVVESNGDNL